MYLEKINGPEDVKKIKIDELPVLAQEIRDALLVRASKHGGHFGNVRIYLNFPWKVRMKRNGYCFVVLVTALSVTRPLNTLSERSTEKNL